MKKTKHPIDTHMIKHRSIVGALAFTGRTFLLQMIGFVAFFLLTVFLTEEEYGIFFVVDATVAFLVYFSDIGLGAALIQKKEKLTQADLNTTFTIQQALVLTLVAIALFFSNSIAGFYNYDQHAVFLFQALIVSFFLSSLKTIPSILLERELEFNKLVVPQVLEQIAFYGIAVYMAWKGYGVQSYTVAVLTRAVIGLVAIYVLKPWVPGFGFDRQVAKRLVAFGAPFQLNSILALFKDKLLIIFLAKILSPAELGYIGWAEKWAQTPIRFFADPVLKVTFSAYSRLQDELETLKKAIEKSIFFVSTLVFPSVFGMIALAPSFLSYIPQYQKWQPALIALTFFGINVLFSSISITLTNTLLATGKVKLILKLMVMWTVLTWILTPLGIRWFGYHGVAIASAATASSSLIAYYLVYRIVKVDLMGNVLPPLFSSLIMYGAVAFLAARYATSLFNTFVLVGIGALVYFAAMWMIAPKKLIAEIAIVTKYLRLK